MGHPRGRSRVSTNSSEGQRGGVSTPAMAWNAMHFFGRGVGIEVDGEGFDERGAIGADQRVEPGVRVGESPALQPDPHGAIQPAGHPAQLVQQRLAQQQAFALRCDRAEPQSATLAPLVDDGAPLESGATACWYQSSTRRSCSRKRVDDQW